jgi:hypothetical protein
MATSRSPRAPQGLLDDLLEGQPAAHFSSAAVGPPPTAGRPKSQRLWIDRMRHGQSDFVVSWFGEQIRTARHQHSHP